MSIPKINQPTFITTLPSTKKKIRYRQFTVKEEKILLVAQESKDKEQIVDSVKQVLANCIIDDIDIDDLALFDVQYLLIQLRSKSVNNIVEFELMDEHQKRIPLTLDLDKIEVQYTEGHSREIHLNDETILFLRYPKMPHMLDVISADTEDKLYRILIDCIDKLKIGEAVYDFSEYEYDEMVEFIESLSSKNMLQIEKFLRTMPTVTHTIEYTDSAGEKQTTEISGFDAFFI